MKVTFTLRTELNTELNDEDLTALSDEIRAAFLLDNSYLIKPDTTYVYHAK